MNARGFTLIEMMVVVVIIAIVINFAMISFGRNSPADRLETESNRLMNLIQVASEEALLRASILGVDISEDGYAFLRLEDGEWQTTDDSLFRERKLPDDMELRIIEGQPESDDEEKRTPEIILLDSGEVTPFDLKITSTTTDTYFRLTGSETGDLKLNKVASD